MVHKTIRKVLKKKITDKRTFIKNKNQSQNQSQNQSGGVIEKQVGLYNQNEELKESAIEQSVRLSRSGLKLTYPGDVNTLKNNAVKAKNTRKFGFTDFTDNSEKNKSQLTPKFFYKNVYPTYLISHTLDTPTQSDTTGVGESSNDNNNENDNENETGSTA